MINNILVFGTGYYWETRKNYILNRNNIVAFLDSDIRKEGKEICGKIVYLPNEYKKFEYDFILIVSDKYQSEMRKQLLDGGVIPSRVINWEQYVKTFLMEDYIEYLIEPINKFDTVIFSNYLNYTGAPMTAIYMAYALKSKGKKVVICAENIDEKLREELKEKVSIVLIPSIMFVTNHKLNSIMQQCDNVIVNTFVMYFLVCRIGKNKKILWWIHETKDNFEKIENAFQHITNELLQNVNIKAVSKIAKDNFNLYFHNMIKEVMPYGIPDKREKSIKKKKNKIIFALIGTITVRKAQDIYIEAIKNLSSEDREGAEFYIIGKVVDNNYTKKILKAIKGMNNIHITGEMTRTQLSSFFSEIDVVVCPSREETMSITLTEAMMYGKACLSSDNTGMADYIVDGRNGFVCKTGDTIELKNKMQWFIRNPEIIDKMGEEARRTYEKYFTMEVFSQNLEVAMHEISKENV